MKWIPTQKWNLHKGPDLGFGNWKRSDASVEVCIVAWCVFSNVVFILHVAIVKICSILIV